LAGLAVDFWKDKGKIAQKWKVDREFKSNTDKKIKEKLYKSWKKAVKRALNWEKKGKNKKNI